MHTGVMAALLVVGIFGVVLSTVVPVVAMWCSSGRPVLGAERESREVIAA